MADRMRVTSLIRSRIPPQQEAGKNGPRKTVLALVGLLDRTAKCTLCNLLRTDTPRALARLWRGGTAGAGRPRCRSAPLGLVQVSDHARQQLEAGLPKRSCRAS